MASRKVPFLKGAFTPLVVPFKNGVIDYGRYAELIEWQIEQGTPGLLVNATSGEPTTLTQDEKGRLPGGGVPPTPQAMPYRVLHGPRAEKRTAVSYLSYSRARGGIGRRRNVRGDR